MLLPQGGRLLCRCLVRLLLPSPVFLLLLFWPVITLSQPRPGPIPVVVGTVIEQPIAAEIEVVGTVEPHLTTTLDAEIAGLTLRFDPQEGDRVQQGQTVVAQLKAADLELALAEAEAELAKAKEIARKLKRGLRPEEIDEKRAEVQERKTWVEKYRKDLERAKSLQTRDIASASEYDLAESTYFAAQAQYERVMQSLRVAELGTREEDIAVAEAEVKRLQATTQRLREDIAKTTIRSPVSGFITRRYTEIGRWIEQGGHVADLVDLSVVLVRVPIHERDIAHLQVGDEATVVLDAFPDRTFPGRVKHIIPQADPASRTFPVKIAVTNTPDIALKAGMSARVHLQAGPVQVAVLVPKDAVARRAAQQVVFRVQEQTARMVPIKTGRAHAGWLEVLNGSLQPGDTVVITGNETLRDQAAILIKGQASP
jgi:multidrug efflux pump subunit AcrA (membrane-fusion protein)